MPSQHKCRDRRQTDGHSLETSRSPCGRGAGENIQKPHCFGIKLVFSHFATSGTLGIFLLSYSHWARYCICAVCSFMCSSHPLVPKNFSGFMPASTSSG